METGKLASMARVLQHLPQVLLLSWSLGGFLTPVLAQEVCNAAEVVLDGGEQRTFPNYEVESLKAELTLFVKRETSFEGISIDVDGTDGTEHTAWFPAEEECFPDMAVWYQLLTFVKIKTEKSVIEFGFETESCRRTCERDNATQSLQSQSVVAHGTSRWRTHFPPKACPKKTLSATRPKSIKLPTCNKPEAPMSTATTVGITIVVLLGITVLVVVVVGAVFSVKKGYLGLNDRCSYYLCATVASQPSQASTSHPMHNQTSPEVHQEKQEVRK